MTAAPARLFKRIKDNVGTQLRTHAPARFSMTVGLCVPQVCVDNVLKTMKENANKASSILLTAIPQISQMDWASTIKTLKVSLHSHPSEEVVKADVYAFAIEMRHIFMTLTTYCCTFLRLLQEQSSHLLLPDNKLVIASLTLWPSEIDSSLLCCGFFFFRVFVKQDGFWTPKPYQSCATCFHAPQEQTCAFFLIKYLFHVFLLCQSVAQSSVMLPKH